MNLIGCFVIQYIAVYFYEFCSILTNPQGESKYKERVNIYSVVVYQKISLAIYYITSMISSKRKLS